jgi:hypothetical protein
MGYKKMRRKKRIWYGVQAGNTSGGARALTSPGERYRFKKKSDAVKSKNKLLKEIKKLRKKGYARPMYPRVIKFRE